ncbi:transposase family protein [Bacillus sp. S3]|uniref:transposase family protein n=1 Tax=Bacillus sp. S3 TaxID=486398 RepID=UPI00118C4BAD|nr:transposase family protein [Bacillus sp. S3]
MSPSSVHSTYPKSFQDLPMQGNKVMIHLNNRKLFCKNPTCSHKTFTERVVSMHCSSVTASKVLSRSTANISKSTLLKKMH